jgi:hypothetical protein
VGNWVWVEGGGWMIFLEGVVFDDFFFSGSGRAVRLRVFRGLFLGFLLMVFFGG